MTTMRPTRFRTIILLATVAALFAVMLAPGVNATLSTTYGDIVEKKSSTTEVNTVTFHSTSTIDLTRFKASNDGTVDWYLDLDNSGASSTGDIRLNQVTTAGSFSVGTVIRSGDNDIGRTLSINGALCYIPTNTDTGSYHYRGANAVNPPHPGSSFTPDGEPVYIMKDSCTTVQTGQDQVRLTKAPTTKPNFGGGAAGSKITSSTSNTDVGQTTTAVTTHHANARIRFIDLDLSGGLSTSDPVYLVLDGTTATGPSPGDIRLWASSSTINFGSFAYGSYVEIDDMDSLRTLTALGSAQLRFNAEGSGATLPQCSSSSLQHDIWLDIDGSGTVTVGDILLAKKSGGTTTTNVTEGMPIRAGNTHLTTTLTGPITGSLAYVDHNGDGAFNYGDNIYLDIGGGSADNKISAADVPLSTNTFGQASGSTGFGDCVTSSNNQINQPLITTGFPPTFSFMSAWNDASYQPGDLVYVGATQVTIGDVRWSSVLTSFGSIGTVVDDNDQDRTYTLSTTGFTPSICFTPTTGTTYRLEDPVYLQVTTNNCGTSIKAGDVRLSGTGSKAAGTTVQVGDEDFNNPTQQLASAVLRYAETSETQGSSSTYDPFDDVYLDVNGGTAQVEVTDLRVTTTAGGSAGTKVTSSDTDVSDTLRDFPAAAGGTFDIGRIKFLKVVPATSTTSTFSTTYRFSDIVVYDMNNNGLVDLGDIFLIGSGGSTSLQGAPTGGGGGGGTVTPSNSAPTAVIECRGAIGDETIHLDGTKSFDPDGTITGSYEWTFGDGKTATGQTVSHTYESAGTFTVRLTLTDNKGATGSSSDQVKIPLEQVNCRPEPVGTTPTTPATTPTETTTETATTTPTDTPAETPTDTPTGTEPVPTPGPGALLLLTVVGALVWVVRRKQ